MRSSRQAANAVLRTFRPKSRPFLSYRRPSNPLLPSTRSPTQSRPLSLLQTRHFSNRCPLQRLTSPPSSSPQPSSSQQQEEPRADVPGYEITFTCKKCHTRSTHRISKQGYHHGTVLVQCPGCKNRHLIADHLKIFSDKRVTLEDILRLRGQEMKTGQLSAEGDIEIWDDGTRTERVAEGEGKGKEQRAESRNKEKE